MKYNESITSKKFSEMFEIKCEDLPLSYVDFINDNDFKYRVI